jgi:hypothetical protein
MNYIPSQAYNLYPCVMTGRDYNKEQGKYKKLPFIAMAGELSDNCYYRKTEFGYVLYKCNGYLQPVFVKSFGLAKYFSRVEKSIVDVVVKWIECDNLNALGIN